MVPLTQGTHPTADLVTIPAEDWNRTQRQTSPLRTGMRFLGMGRAVLGLDRAAPLSDAIGMMVDDTDGFAGMIVKYADGKVEAPAFELGPDANEVHLQFYDNDNLPHAQLNFDGKSKPAWQFDDAESAAKAAQLQSQ